MRIIKQRLMSTNSVLFFLINILLTILLFPFFFVSILIITIVLLYLDIDSPVFFKQTRMGRLGYPFNVVKFRTLKDGNYSHKFAYFLRFTGLDETPQIINIIKGDMLLFGPRPKLSKEIPKENIELYERIVLKRFPGLLSLYISKKGPGQSILQEQDIPELLTYEKYEQENFSVKLMIVIFYLCLRKCINGISCSIKELSHNTN